MGGSGVECYNIYMNHQTVNSRSRQFQIMREVTKTAQLQRRHFVWWILIFAIVFGLIFLAQNAKLLMADEPDLIEETSVGNDRVGVDIVIQADGIASIAGKPTTKIFRPLIDFDEFKYKILDKPGYFIDQLVVRVKFAQALPPKTNVLAFAVHGIDSHTEKQINANTIEFIANDIGPEAVYTISAQLPKGSIAWPWWRVLLAIVNGLPIGFWLTLAACLPLITATVLVVMFYPNLKLLARRSAGLLSTPPSQLPAGLVGILVHGRVSAREIAATILDLANRGYLTIFDHGNGKFSLAKSRGWQNLQAFELLLLDQLFNSSQSNLKQITISSQDLEEGISQNLFSTQIAAIYVAMYDAATAAGYFKQNPAQIHQTYRMIGLFLFFVGLGAFGVALMINLEPNYLLFFFAGMMTMALVIIVSADDVPLLTEAGEQARQNWLNFADHLRYQSPISYTEGAQSHYERYLPYAVVLNSELKWVNRFRDHPFGQPSWYDSTEQTIRLSEFANNLHRIVGSIAQLFAVVKEPSVH